MFQWILQRPPNNKCAPTHLTVDRIDIFANALGQFVERYTQSDNITRVSQKKFQVVKEQAWPTIKKVFRKIFIGFGIFSFVLLVFSFTRVPFDIHWWLGKNGSEYYFKPDHIVFLGGSGMPSESNLIRIYYTSALAKKHPKAKVLVAHPIDEEVIALIRLEMIQKGIDSSRIEIEKRGTNTREQAITIAEDFPEMLNQNIVLVTSPENMMRTVKVFWKAGFKHVGGEPAFENAMFVDLAYNHIKVGGKKYSPDVSSNLALRYNFWNYLKLEITCLREFVALGYYKFNGWI